MEHARAAEPDEAAGHVIFKDGLALRYEPGINLTPSPYHFLVHPGDPEIPFLEDEGFEVALFHSHISSPARPSKTDVENARYGWPNRPYLIYSIRSDKLAAFRITEAGRVEELPLSA